MENQVAQSNQSKAVANPEDVSAWGGGQTLTSNDILIGKILPLQFMSDKVRDKQGEYGEFRDTVLNKKFGDLTSPVEFIPFYMEKKWIEFQIVTNKAGAKKREFLQVVPNVDDPRSKEYNDDLPYVDEGKGIERDRIMDFYVLIPSEVKEGGAMPYILSFRRTSIKAGKKLAMQMFKRNVDKKLTPASVTMLLSGKSVTNDDGEFVVMDVEAQRATTQDELAAAFDWYKIVKSGKAKVDQSDYHEEAKGPKNVTPNSVQGEPAY